jgi:SAM-dependent methyltransferase
MPAMNYARIAEKYDAYVTWMGDVAFFLEEARQAGGPVLELMSGTGRLSLPLIEAGTDLTCVDSSPAMLAILRRKLAARGLAAACIEQDVRELDVPRYFALIIIPFHSFSELLTVEDQRQTLERIYAQLAPTGRFICTLHNPSVRMQPEDGRLRLFGQYPLADGTLLLWGFTRQSPGEPLVTGMQLYEEYNADDVLREKSFVNLQFRLVDHDAFVTLVVAAGFRVVDVYGTYDRAPFDAETSPFMIWVLEKA